MIVNERCEFNFNNQYIIIFPVPSASGGAAYLLARLFISSGMYAHVRAGANLLQGLFDPKEQFNYTGKITSTNRPINVGPLLRSEIVLV